MSPEELHDWCLGRVGAEETFPFNASTSVFKVGGKMFALSALSDEPLRVSVKCDPDYAEELREAHEAIIPGYHLNKRHWITVTLGGDAGDDLVRLLVAESHALVAPWRRRRRGGRAADGLTGHARINREVWDGLAGEFAADGELKWAMDDPVWGIWKIPERELGVLPDVAGLDVVELGCGTAYWSAWLARRGARPTGVNNSARTARDGPPAATRARARLPPRPRQRGGGPPPGWGLRPGLLGVRGLPVVRPRALDPRGGPAAAPGRPAGLPDPHADPHALHPGLRRLPDRRPAGAALLRHARFDWLDHPSIEFNMTYGDWIAELRRVGLRRRGPARACRRRRTATRGAHDYVTADWSHRWPQEAIWVARLRG